MRVELGVEASCQLMMEDVALLMVKLLVELLSGDDSAKLWWKERVI